MAILKKVVLVYEKKPVHVMALHDNQGLYRVHEQTHKVEEIELKYKENVVEFDINYHYTAALSVEKALEKYKKFKEQQEKKTKGHKPLLN